MQIELTDEEVLLIQGALKVAPFQGTFAQAERTVDLIRSVLQKLEQPPSPQTEPAAGEG